MPRVSALLVGVPAIVLSLVACSGGGGDPAPSSFVDVDSGAPTDASYVDSAVPDVGDATPDASDATDASDAPTDGATACSVFGAPGQCLTVSECAALTSHTSYTGHCSGSASIECCIKTPNVADNPPIPTGYKLMAQSQVTTDMTNWAVAILHDPVTYPMFSTTTKTFGTLTVLARVEWHAPDFLNKVVHRGVTLYQPG